MKVSEFDFDLPAERIAQRPLTRPLRRQPHRDCRGGEMADAEDSKSSVRKHMRVQVPPSALQKNLLSSGLEQIGRSSRAS